MEPTTDEYDREIVDTTDKLVANREEVEVQRLQQSGDKPEIQIL